MIGTDIEPRRKIVLLDLERCSSIRGRDDVETVLGTAERIVAFRTRGEPHVPLSLVRSLAAGLAAGRVVIEEVPRSGHLAADFGLLFWAGRLLGETPPEVEIVVVSRGEALDHAVASLKRAGRRAIGVDDHKGPRRSPAEVVARPASLAAHLQELTCRPKSTKALRNYVRSYVGNKQRNVDEIVADLADGGHIAIDQRGNVTYPALASGGNGATSRCSEHDEDCIPF
jgi:hypothetical protein